MSFIFISHAEAKTGVCSAERTHEIRLEQYVAGNPRNIRGGWMDWNLGVGESGVECRSAWEKMIMGWFPGFSVLDLDGMVLISRPIPRLVVVQDCCRCVAAFQGGVRALVPRLGGTLIKFPRFQEADVLPKALSRKMHASTGGFLFVQP